MFHNVQLRFVYFYIHVSVEYTNAVFHSVHTLVKVIDFSAEVFKQRKEVRLNLMDMVDVAEFTYFYFYFSQHLLGCQNGLKVKHIFNALLSLIYNFTTGGSQLRNPFL